LRFALLASNFANAAVKPFAVKSATPDDGAVSAASSSVTFQVKTDDQVGSLARIEVATQPTLGQDGTLAHWSR